MAKERELVTIRGSRVVHIHRSVRYPVALVVRVTARGRVVQVPATFHLQAAHDYMADMSSWLHYLQEHRKVVPLVAC